MPGLSEKERAQAESEARQAKGAALAAARRQIAAADPVADIRTKRRAEQDKVSEQSNDRGRRGVRGPPPNMFAEPDEAETARRLMQHVSALLPGSNIRSAGSSRSHSGVSLDHRQHAAPTGNKKRLHKPLKERWRDMQKTLAEADGAAKSLQLRSPDMIASSPADPPLGDTPASVGRAHSPASTMSMYALSGSGGYGTSGSSDSVSNFGLQSMPVTGRQPRILALGKHRSDYLAHVFAQLGRGGVLGREQGSGRGTGVALSPTDKNKKIGKRLKMGKRRKKKVKKKNNKKSPKRGAEGGGLQHVMNSARTSLARRRELQASGWLDKKPSAMFDSLNYKACF